jgi:phosphoserine phosphatase RsbU/P
VDADPNPYGGVSDPGRVAAVGSTVLLHTPPEEAFVRLTRSAPELVDAPMVFVTLIDDT